MAARTHHQSITRRAVNSAKAVESGFGQEDFLCFGQIHEGLPHQRLLCLAFMFILVALLLPVVGGAEELRTASAVRHLTPEQAAQKLPVRLRAVVTFFDETLYSRFVQDETAGIYLRESTNTPALLPGQIV